jgi:hypothetical protein
MSTCSRMFEKRYDNPANHVGGDILASDVIGNMLSIARTPKGRQDGIQ